MTLPSTPHVSPPSSMPSVTIAVGAASCLLGAGLVAGAISHGSTWVTAAIPAYVGVLFVVLGTLAKNPKLRMHAIHAALLLALLLVLGGLGMGVPKIIKHASGHWPADKPAHPLAWWGQVSLAAVMAVYVALAVKSFIAAKRWKRENTIAA